MNKWSVFDHAGGTFQSVAMSLHVSGQSGVVNIVTGNGDSFNSGTAYASTQTMAYVRLTLSGGLLTGATRNGTVNTYTNFVGASLPTGGVFRVEIYANNAASTVTYSRAGVLQTVASGKYDVFVDGVRIADEVASAGTLPAGSPLDSFTLWAQSSPANNLTVRTDDLTYSNQAPTTSTGTTAGWRLLGVPAGLASTTIENVLMPQHLVQGLSDEYATGQPNLYTTWNGDGSYTRPDNQQVALEPGKGFVWFLFASGGPRIDNAGGESMRRPLPVMFSTNGLTLPGAAVSATFASRAAGEGAYMLANPYPVAFDVDAVTADNAAVLSTNYYVQDPGVQALTAKSVSDDPTEGTDLVAPWQGFFREFTAPPIDEAVTFTYALNGARGGAVGAVFKAGTSAGATIAIQVDGRTHAGVDVRDGGNLLVLRNDATDGWDRHDGSKFYMPSGTRVAAAFVGPHADGQTRDKSVESRAPGATATVPMTFTATAAGEYRFAWEDVGAWPSGAPPVLVDGLTGARTPMLGAGEYRFTSDATLDSRRFSIEFTGTTTDADTLDRPIGLRIAAFTNPLRDATRLTVDVPSAGPLAVTVVDLLGRTVATLHDASATPGSVALDLDASALPAGVYVLRAVAVGATATRTFVVAH